MISKLIQVAVALLCLGAAAAVLRDNGLPTSASRMPGSGQSRAPAIGAAAPSFTLQTHRLEDFTLRPAEGATVLNFWATWCQPCRAEMAQLQAMLESEPESPRVIAVNLGESYTPVRKWVEDLGLTFTVLLDPQFSAASLYGVRGLPTTFLLDSQLMVKRIYFGPVSAAELLRSIDGIAKGS
ncbi:MAG: TlpA disulfide reductase family protein [Chloroflexota bacterium]|nr:TlpA disulfide reductase family protein [Chloroflexota bacterium]